MSSTRVGTATLALALLMLAAGASTGIAQCCGSLAHTVGYQPVTAFQPVAVQTAQPYTGWYPGYWLGRLFRPTVHTVAYAPAPTFAVAAPMYTASYAPAVHTVGYSGCATCCSSPCSCTQNVVLRPVTCCDPCSTCATCACNPCSCASGGVAPAAYESSGGCANCAAPATYTSPSDMSTPRTFEDNVQPELAPDEQVPTQRSLRLESPSTMPLDNDDYEDDSVGTPSSYFQAPKLFNPNDNVTDRRAAVPVWTAVYQRPVESAPPVRHATHTSINRAQAEKDAQGWTAAN